MSSLPLQKSKERLKKEGYLTWKVEQWVGFPKPGHRQDMFNCMDLVAIRADHSGVLAVQACVGGGVSAHAKKCMNEPHIRGAIICWLAAKNRFAIYGWRKVGAEGKRKLWEVRIVNFYVESTEEGFYILKNIEVTP